MNRERSLGIAAGVGPQVAGEVALAAQELGFTSVWTNDTPSGDGLAVAAAMMSQTDAIRVGIGALAVNRWTPERAVARLEELGIDFGRLTIVLGAGQADRPLAAVASAVEGLREILGGAATIGVAALGPKMVSLAGQIGDLVLLNWVTPQKASESKKLVQQAAQQGQPSGGVPAVASYIRVAIGPDARARLDAEASGYLRLAHYQRHFQSIGEPPGIAAFQPVDVPESLAPYDRVLDETIVRAVPADNTAESIYEIAKAAAPAAKPRRLT